ncbi:phospholipase A-2-activating protein isoform X1 [Lucilia cuprina]|uniref:phospholipase A-2-activating protein isoform X1 n=1 Tax=Lucilia cuprina TaxID=7375 RepID=UPI001F06BA69|nr:phospholipase A-2-activating protein isoform X1 [Lucilia cuprina]
MSFTLDNYKLSCELLGHSMDVRSIATGATLAEGGQMIISGSRDKTTKLWKPLDEGYIEAVTLQDHKNFVACVYYCERQRWLCTGSNDATVCIYQENSLLPILTLKGHESTVCSIASGVEPQNLITGSWDKTARIWSIDQDGGITFVELKGHEAAVWAVASMPESKKYITGSADKNIFYWNIKGEKLRMLKGHTDCVRGILPLSNGGLISCANDAIIRVWNEDGECVQQMSGHTNYIYAVAQQKALAQECIVSCGEDSSLRMWNINTGQEVGAALIHPAQSVWSVTCLSNGDIATGSSDGVVRVFTKDPQRMASEAVLNAYQLAVETRKQQMSEELGGVKKTDLPGPEALLTNGTREGQTKMVRHADGSVKCYNWELGKWNLVGDVTGASGGSQASSGKSLYEGKEYDYVFSVDISDTEPPLKLPYNRGEDPWHSAQAFIHRNNLPQVYLDQVANFIIKNSNNAPVQVNSTTGAYHDPFTGGNRYVPGSSNSNFQSIGNADPFTGGSSYTTAAANQPKVDVNFVKGLLFIFLFNKLYFYSYCFSGDKHFPISTYLTFDNCDPSKVLEKLKEFNNKLPATNEKVSNNLLESVIRLTDAAPDVDQTAIEALQILLRWPSELLFPVIDIVRLAVRSEAVFSLLNSMNFLDALLQHLTTSVPNQLMIIRCLANIMKHEAGRQQVDKRLAPLIEHINGIKSGSNNLQIAIATFYLNLTTTQTTSVANGEKCRMVTEGLVEFLKWATDLEACYRSMQAIGNLTTTPFGQEASALVISVDYVMDKLRELTNTPQAGVYAKINSAGTALLAAF